MSQKKRKILIVSRNPTLAQFRKTVCEGAGFTVIAATNDGAVESACRNGIEFILVGYSVAPSDKRRVWAKSRQCSDVPILELQRSGNPELMERNVFAQESKCAHDFLMLVQKLPLGETKIRFEASLQNRARRSQAAGMRESAAAMRKNARAMQQKKTNAQP